jgi:hypothetical protein
VGLIDVYRINPADSFSVKSASLKKQQDITYFTLLAKIRGDLNLTSIDSNVDNWNSAYDNVVVSGNVTGYDTKTINLVRRDGSVVSFNFTDLNPQSQDTLDMVTTRGNVTVNTIDVGGVLTPWVDLDTSYSNGNIIGRISWDQDNATMDVGLNSNTILKVGQDDLWYVKNQTGSTIPKGTAVMAVGTLGASGRILVAPMVSNGTISPKYLLGVTAEAIPNGIDGYVLAKGKLRQINTSAYTDGQVLWCSPTVPGALTATEPQAPNLKLPIAFVVNAANNGTLAIRTTAGATLSEDNQVQLGTLANNDVLTYISANGRWQNVPIGNLAATLAFRTIAVSGQFSIVADSAADTLTVAAGTGVTITTNAGTDTLTITNSAPDQVVSITGAGTSVVTGSYPNFTVTSADQFLGTVTSVSALTIGTTGTDLSSTVANSTTTPVITLQVPTASATNRGALSSADWITFNSKQEAITLTTTGSTGAATFISNTLNIPNYGSALTGYVPYTGANQTVNLNTQQLQAGHTTLTTNGSTETLTVNHTSGSGIAVNITKGGNNEGLRVDKTSGSGNAATIIGTLEATKIVKTGGTTSQFLKANGDVDSSVYYLASNPSGFTTNLGTVTSVGVTAGTGITVSGSPITSSGSITVTNNDRGSSQNIFKNIAVPTQATITASSNNDTFTIKPGSGISATTTGNDITISNTDPGSAQNIFKNIAVAGQSTVVADINNDTLTLVAGTNVTITTNATTDSVTINASAPSNPTPGNAVYARDYAAPFAITSTWTMVNLNSTNIRVTPNKTLTSDNRGYFFVTFEVEDLSAGPSFRFFKYKLYNADTASDVVGSESYWTGYMYGTTEVPYTTFSFHIPSDDASVSAGDSIELQVQEISTGTAPNITYAALSYIDANG